MGNPDVVHALTNDDIYMLAEGDWFRSYEKMGAHPATVDGVEALVPAVSARLAR